MVGKPVTSQARAGIELGGLGYEPSWSSIPFEGYDGMTQLQFQESNAPYLRHGGEVPAYVPPGWRKVESKKPGKHLYVHLASGTISHVPVDIFDPKAGAWVEVDASKRDKKAPVALPPLPTRPAPAQASPAALPPPSGGSSASLPVALLFPGQGSQYVKMMAGVKDLPAVKEMLATANKILDFDLLELCLKGPEAELERTKFCQPAMYVAGLAGMEKLKSTQPEKVDRCQAVAGLSLGEYTALTAAGVFDFETGLKVVKLRGEAMQEAAEASQQAMLSVAGLGKEILDKLCGESVAEPGDVCQVANFLFPNGFSCAGTLGAIQRLEEKVKATEGCLQAKMLKTSGGFHTKLMEPAREKLLAALKDAEPKMKPPRCDVYMNITGKKISAGTPPGELLPLLADQLVNCVLWEPAVSTMIQDGLKEFFECGPMKQLKSMMKRIDTEAFGKTANIDV